MSDITEALTPHWTDVIERDGVLGPTKQRYGYVHDKVRFKIALAGRRSTKTLWAKRRIVEALSDCLDWDEQTRPWWWNQFPLKFAYVAPTQDQANAIAWGDCKKLCPADWVYKIYEGEKPKIITRFGTELHILGADKPERIEGTPWCGYVLDEFPNFKASAWENHIFPTLSDRQAWCLILGVPDAEAPNNETFLSLFDKGQLQEGQTGYDPNFKSYTWTSEEVLPSEEIALAKESLTPRAYRVEYLASRESLPGRAYPDFVKSVHANAKVEFNPALPLMISCDFNREHHTWGEYQYEDGRYKILADLYVRGGTVEAMCEELKGRLIKKRLPEKGKGIQFFGDYSGTQKRAEATASSWVQIKSYFPDAEYLFLLQTPVTDRLEKANAFVMNAAGESHLDVDERATIHIADFERVSRAMAFAGDGGKDGELTHASSAFGYLVVQHQIALASFKRSENTSQAMKKIRNAW